MPKAATHNGDRELLRDAEDDEHTAELDHDDVFHVLQCERRRRAIEYLLDHEGAAEMSDIAESIAAEENDKPVKALRSEERQRVYIALYQAHLPKMDDLGVIDYEQGRGTVTPTELLSAFEPYVTTDDDEEEQEEGMNANDPNTHTNYLFASGGSLAIVLGFLLNAPLLSLIPATMLLILVSGGFSVFSMVQYLTDAADLPA